MSSELTRNPDYTWVATNHEERLRKLETGVHPLSAGGTETTGDYGPGAVQDVRWRVRGGVVILDGGWSRTWGNEPSATFGNLPEDARPAQAMTLLAYKDVNPPVLCRVTIGVDGLMTVYNDSGGTGNFVVRADGLTFPKG